MPSTSLPVNVDVVRLMGQVILIDTTAMMITMTDFVRQKKPSVKSNVQCSMSVHSHSVCTDAQVNDTIVAALFLAPLDSQQPMPLASLSEML